MISIKVNDITLTEEQINQAVKDLAKAKELASRYVPKPGDIFRWRRRNEEMSEDRYVCVVKNRVVNIQPGEVAAISMGAYVGHFTGDDEEVTFVKVGELRACICDLK